MKKIITILTAIATCASMSARMMVYSANDVEFYLKIVSASAGTISADGTIITFASPAEAKGAKLVVQEFIKADHSNPFIQQVGSTFSVNDKSISLDNGVSYSDPIGQEKEYTLNGNTVTTDCFVSCFAYANKRKKFASGTGDATWGHSKDYTWAYDGVDQMTIIWASSFDDPNYDNSTETAHFQGNASDAFPFTQFEATIGHVTDGTYTIDIIDSWEHAELGTQNGTFINVDGKNKILVTNHPGIKIVVGDSGSSTDDPGNGGGTDTKDDVVSVTSGETTTNYESLDEAFKAAKDGDVITLKEDYAVPVDAGKDIYGLIDCNAGTSEAPVVLDLAGHTLSFPDGGHIIVNLGHALTIRDSGTGGKITSAEGYVVINTATGTLRLENGTLESTFTGDGNEQAKGAVYNRGVMFVDGGTVSGQKYGIYTEGALTLGEGKIAASQGFGVVVSSEGEITMLKFPEFDCMSDDIALADGKLIYYGGKIYGTPKNKIKIYLENKEQKYFTYGYGEDMRTEDGGITEPSDVFYVSGISDARIGFYETDRYLEAGIADETEVTFPAGNSTYFDERALALGEWNDDLKFYAVTSVDTENKSVILTEIKSKRFGGHASLIVSNTSGAPITVKMVEAACGMMENSFIGSFNNDLRGDNDPDEVNIYPGFEGTDEAIEQIDKMDGFEYYGFNGEDFVPLSNLGPVEAHRCWLGIGEFPDFDEGDEGEGEEGGLPAGARKLSVVWPGSAAKSNTGASGETFNLTLATDAEAHGTVSFSVDGTTLTSDNKTASEGQTVTITVTPTVTQYSAYVVQSITAKPSMTTSHMKVRGNILDEVTLTPAGANTWTMTMPAADVEVGISYGTLSVAKVEIENPQLLTVGKTFEVTIGKTQYAPQEVTQNYYFDPVTGVTVDAVIKIALESTSGNKAIYKVTDNYATKLTFGDVEWKESGALLTRPKNLTFSGAAVDVSNIHFTNASTLSTGDKMTLVKDFGDAVGTITGSNFTDASSCEGAGHPYLENYDIHYLVTEGTDTQHITNTKTNDDGSITVTDTYIYKDGSMTVKETVTNSPDGSTTVKETVKDADGSMTVKETVTNPVGPTIETATTRVKNADGSITETIKKKVTNPDGTETTTENTKETVTNPDGSTAVKETVKDADGSMTVKETVKDADGNIHRIEETVDANGNTTKVETITNPVQLGGTATVTGSNGESTILGVIKGGKDISISEITNQPIAIENGKEGAMAIEKTTKESFLANATQNKSESTTTLRVSSGAFRAGMKITVLQLANGSSIWEKTTIDGSVECVVTFTSLARRHSATRGAKAARPFFRIDYSGANITCKAGDVELQAAEEAHGINRGDEQDIIIESGKTYDILTDKNLILTLQPSESDFLLTSFTMIVPKDSDPNDINGDGDVNAVDLVKAIAAGKTQAEIDAIVNSIMGK